MPNLTLTLIEQYSSRCGENFFSPLIRHRLRLWDAAASRVIERIIQGIHPGVGRQTRVEDNQKTDDRRQQGERRAEDGNPREPEQGKAPSLFSKSPAIAIPSLSSLKKPASIPKPGAGSPFERPPQFAPSPPLPSTPDTSPVLGALPPQEDDALDDDEDLRTQNISPEELEAFEFDSIAEDDEQEGHTDEHLGAEPHAFQNPGAPVPAFGATPASPPVNPYMRPEVPAPVPTPPAQPGGGSKRTLLGMQAPNFATPNFGQEPLPPGAPAPGSGAQAFQGRALSFGAEHAYSSSRMPQPPQIQEHLHGGDELTEVEDQAEYDAGEATSVFTPPDAYEPEPATMISDAPVGDPGELDFSLDGEEMDEDFAAQKTEVIQSPFEQEAILPKLKIIEGPMLDHEFILTELRSTIGRGNNTSIMVEDLAMSRLHFEIIRNADDTYLIRDLGSANGIGLNNTRIKEAILQDGDRVEAGKTILVFAHPSSPPRAHRHMIAVAGATLEGAAPAPPLPEELQPVGPDEQTRLAALQIDQSTRMFTRIALGAGALCIPLCFLLVFAINSRGSSTTPSSGDGEELPVEQRATAIAPSSKAIDLYLAGAELIKGRQWEEARARFEEASKTDPSMDIAPQLERIEREIEAKQKLARARTELQDPEEIKALASTIPPQSAYYDEAQTLIQLNRQDEVTTIYQEAATLLGEDKLDEASAKLDTLARISPDHTGIPDLREKIEARRTEIEEEQRRQEEQDRVNDKANDIFKNSGSSSSSSSSDSKADLSDGYSHYKRKNFRSAASSFKKAGGSKGKRLAKHAQTVESQWSAGEKALEARKYTSAVSALEKALGADRNINKAHRKSIQTSLASAYGNAGLSKLKAKDYRSARKYLAKGEKLKINHNSLKELDRGLENEAKKVYIQAVNKKKSNPEAAFDLCRKIMLMLPSSSPTYQKAQKLILTL